MSQTANPRATEGTESNTQQISISVQEKERKSPNRTAEKPQSEHPPVIDWLENRKEQKLQCWHALWACTPLAVMIIEQVGEFSKPDEP
jgi:hypothetical protein